MRGRSRCPSGLETGCPHCVPERHSKLQNQRDKARQRYGRMEQTRRGSLTVGAQCRVRSTGRWTRAQLDRAPPTATFTGECAFGEEVVSIIAVTSREATRAQRLESGRGRRREMTVEPDGIDADELGVEATVGCTATGTIRTAQVCPLFVGGERPARRACGHPKKGADCVWMRAMGREPIGAHQAADLGARAHARARLWSVGDVRGGLRRTTRWSPRAGSGRRLLRVRRPPLRRARAPSRARRLACASGSSAPPRSEAEPYRSRGGADVTDRAWRRQPGRTPVLPEVMDAEEAIALAIERRGTVQVVSAWVEGCSCWIESASRLGIALRGKGSRVDRVPRHFGS